MIQKRTFIVFNGAAFAVLFLSVFSLPLYDRYAIIKQKNNEGIDMLRWAIYESKATGGLSARLVCDYEDKDLPQVPPYVIFYQDNDGNWIPNELNLYGGYCAHRPGLEDSLFDFVEYREYQEETGELVDPLSIDEKYPVNKNEFCCGWISPSGTTYTCAPECHSSAADDLAKMEGYEFYYGAEKWLEDAGYVKILHPDECDATALFGDGVFWSDDSGAPSGEQIRIIKKLGRWSEEVQWRVRVGRERCSR